MALVAPGSRALLVSMALAIAISSVVFAADPPTPKIPLSKGSSTTAPPDVGPKPDSIILSPKEYRELLDRIEKLQEQVDAQKVTRPRTCELDGRVELRGKQAVARLRAVFKFTTTRAGAILHLGCQRAQPVEAKLDDGKTPLFSAGEDGLRLQVETPGDHSLRLELDVPVSPRGAKGGELGFDLGLPGCPITLLTFEAPAGVRRYTLSTQTPKPAGLGPVVAPPDVDRPDADRLAPGKGGMPLGPVTSLALAWEDPNRKVDATLSADADVSVTLGNAEIFTEAKLRLRGSTTEWKFTAPATADVTVGLWPMPGVAKVPDLPADRAPNVIRPDAGSTLWRLVFREPTQSELQVLVTTRVDRPRGADTAKSVHPVGPFAVLGVKQQSGTIRVKTFANWKATAAVKGDTRREPEDGSGDLVFRYRYGDLGKPPTSAPVELTFATVPGIVMARVRHELRLTEPSWQLRSEIAISPTRVEVEYVDFEVPASFRASIAEPREIVEELALIREVGADRRVYRARLSSPKKTSFSFTIEGDYPHRPTESNVSLLLPHLLGVTERSTELVVNAPSRFDVRGTFRTWEGPKPGNWETSLQREPSDSGVRLRGLAEKPMASAELTWKLAPVNATVRSEADVDLEESFVRVSQRLSFRFAGKPPRRVRLRIDRQPNSLRANRGSLEAVGVGYDYVLPEESPDSEVVLQYSIPLPPVEGPVIIPLLLPDGLECTNVARIWVAGSRLASLQDGSEWSQLPVEVISDRPTLPALVLKAQSTTTLPKVVLGPKLVSANGIPRIERSTIDVAITDSVAIYRANYWVRELSQPLAFLLPSQANSVEVYVQGKRLVYTSTPDAPNEIVRIPRMKAGTDLVRIEFRYRTTKGELIPPIPAPPTVSGELTWTIASPEDTITLVPGDATGSWSPSAFLTTLGVGSVRIANGQLRFAPKESEPDAVIRQATPGPLGIYETSRNLWLLGWSLGTFTLFGLLSLLGRDWAGLLALVCCLAVLVGTFVFPQPVAQAMFAATPGLLAYLCMRVLLRWAKVRYRRRVKRSIGFSRTASSLVRPNAMRNTDPKSRKSAPVPVPTPSS